MKIRIIPSVVVTMALTFLGGLAWVQAQPPGDDKDPPKVVLGDRDEVAFQNQRYLKVKNDSASTLTVFFQYRTMVKDSFTWLPANPGPDAETVSFQINAGDEVQVKVGEELMSASRVRIWATSETEKWLTYKTNDLWLVPEKNEEGDHVYAAEAQETFSFTFAAKKADTDDPDAAAGSTYPDQDPNLLPEVLPEPGNLLPDGGVMPVIRDLSVRPVAVFGASAVILVKNRGHANQNVGRRLYVRRAVPGAFPADVGQIGPLLHNSVRMFYVVGLVPGNYDAFVGPADDFPYDGNDIRHFTVGGVAFTDLRVLPVSIVGAKATIKVKNVGNAPTAGGRKVNVSRLGGPPLMVEAGTLGPLPVNGVQTFGSITLAAGNYKAYISPGDAGAQASNDSWTFAVAAASFADLKVLPVAVIGGNVHVSVKNIGAAPSASGKNLMVVKLAPGAMPINKGLIGHLGAKDTKLFPPFALPPGSYRAFVSPGDPAPLAGNDFDDFTVGAAPFADLKVMNVSVSGGDIHVSVKNVGTSPAAAGKHLMIVKVPGGVPMDKGVVGPLPAGMAKPFPPFTLPPGNYKAYIDPGDPMPFAGNDFDDFSVGGPGTFMDLELKTKATGDDVVIRVKNVGTAPVPVGRRLKIVKLVAGAPVIDKGPIGPAPLGFKKDIKFTLPPGKYRAYVEPSDAVPHHANDDDTFIVDAALDLGVSEPRKIGTKVRASITNHGPSTYLGGREWRLEKFDAGAAKWSPIAGGGVPHPMANGAERQVEGNFSGPGEYRIRLLGTDGNNTNNSKTKKI